MRVGMFLAGLVLLCGVSGWAQDGNTPTAATAQADPVSVPVPAPVPAASAGKKRKEAYAGPTQVVELAPQPMLDEAGRPRLDPDGKPMFNPAQRQERDKKGHPVFAADGKPVFQTPGELGYDEHGRKIHMKKEKAPKLVSVAISRGTLTVDGMTGKAALNYDIKDLKYIYLYAPGIGTTIVSTTMFPGAIEEKNAFNDKTLSVTVGDHSLELDSDERLLGKKPESAFVRVDREFKLPSIYPAVGYGTLRVAPYAWPGAKENAVLAGTVKAPPLPKNLRPTLLVPACAVGEVRNASLSGEVAPCVAVPKASAPAAL